MPWIALAITTVAALLFATLGFLLGRRYVDPEMRPAWNLFRTWWFAVAAVTAVKPLQVGLYMIDALPVWLYLPLRQAEFIAIAVALWALLCYLLYAYRGTRRGWGLLAVAYGLVAFGLLVLLAYAGEPERLVLENGEVAAQPGLDLSPGFTALVLAVLVAPQIVAAFAYARLYFRVEQATQRFRIALVSAAIIGWFAIRLAGAAADAQGRAWHVTGSLLGLLAALLVLLAYFPPRTFQRRYGLATLAHDSS